MRGLSLTVAHREGEALHGFLGRTAARNGVDLASFCRDMALDLVEVANGVDHAVDRLAELTGADPASLRRSAFIKRDDRTWTLGGEVIDGHMLRRLDARVCPVCLADDVAGHAGHPGQGAYCRTTWLVDQIRTCPIHGVELVDLPPADAEGGRSQLHDFVGRLSRAWGGPAGLPVRPVFVSGLEGYLHGRLGGRRADTWLDALPFNVVATFTERLGMSVLHGSGTRFNELASGDWKAAGDAGWQVMRLGPEGLRDFASRMAADVNVGLRASFGEFWPFLLRASRKPGYQDPCGAVASALLGTRVSIPRRLTDGGGERQVTGVRLSAASAEHRRSTGTLRRVLASRGVLRPEHEGIAAKRIVVERDVVEQAMADLDRRTSLAGAGRHLNAPNRQVGLLHAAGLLGGTAAERRQDVKLTVCRDDLDAFMADLLRDAVNRGQPGVGEGTFVQAAHSARRPFVHVVRLVIDRRLAWVGRQTGVAGVSSVLVRLDEVRRILNGGVVTGPTLAETARVLCIPHPGVAALVADGHLRTVAVRQRRTGQSYRVIDPDSLRAFQDRFVSVSSVARERGMHPHAVRAALAASGLERALPVERYGTSIYAVTDVP